MALQEASAQLGSFLEHAFFTFVNGIGSPLARAFELSIYALIFLAVAVGCWQTVEGEENSFRFIEWIAVVVFTFEYVIRFIGVGSDPEFATQGGNPITCRLKFVFSFYSLVDLAAIVPFYVSLAMPDSGMLLVRPQGSEVCSSGDCSCFLITFVLFSPQSGK